MENLNNPSGPQPETPVLEARNITKIFPGVVANDSISFFLKKGEVLAFLGQL